MMEAKVNDVYSLTEHQQFVVEMERHFGVVIMVDDFDRRIRLEKYEDAVR